MSSSFVKITLKRRNTAHTQSSFELSMPQLVWANTPRHNGVAVTRGDEHDWLMGRWSSSSPPPWLAFSFWQNTVIMGFSDEQAKINTIETWVRGGRQHPPRLCLAPVNLSTPHAEFGNDWPRASCAYVATPTWTLNLTDLFSVLSYHCLGRCFQQGKSRGWIFMVSRLRAYQNVS